MCAGSRQGAGGCGQNACGGALLEAACSIPPGRPVQREPGAGS